MAKRNLTKNSKDALREYKHSEEERNHNNLVKAFTRLVNNEPKIVKRGTKLTVTSVAKEAGLSRGAVYLHQEVLEKITAYKDNPSGSDFQRKKLIRESLVAKEEMRKSMIEQLQVEKHKLAQENFRLTMELQDSHDKLAELRKQRTSAKVVSIRQGDTI